MKFLHSPSSTSDTIHPNYGCFPTILRRLLCFHTLPTLPFDHFNDNHHSHDNEVGDESRVDEVQGSPGIVAKLMGLDSMPMEVGKKVKGSSCVLEYPSFVEVENDKFIILSFEGSGKDKELRLSSTKSGFKEKIRNKKNQENCICKVRENDGEFNDSKSDLEKVCDKRGNLRKKLVERIEIESDSENSSPVSVLEFPDHQQASHLGKEDLKSKSVNSRRKLKEDLDKRAASSLSIDDGVESSGICKKYVGLKKKNFVIRDFKEMWEDICIMAEKDVMDSSRKQRERWKGEDFNEIVACFEMQILDRMILELITTL